MVDFVKPISFKDKNSLAPASLRLQWVEKSIGDNPKLKASGIELDLPQPSYTFQTLQFLKSQAHKFHLIMGSDSFLSLPKWKNADEFMYDYSIEIYERPNAPIQDLPAFPKATLHQLPLLDISATVIRNKIKSKEGVQYFVRDEVLEGG